MEGHYPSITLPTNGSLLGKKFYVSAQGLKEIKEEYEEFKKLMAASGADDSGLLETQLAEIEYILKNALLIKRPPAVKQNIVDFGAKVTVQAQGGKQEGFEIVGCLEANPDLGRVSDESPLGRALLGRKVGDEVVVVASPKTVYKIKKISY